jgi:hypothetical protein
MTTITYLRDFVCNVCIPEKRLKRNLGTNTAVINSAIRAIARSFTFLFTTEIVLGQTANGNNNNFDLLFETKFCPLWEWA